MRLWGLICGLTVFLTAVLAAPSLASDPAILCQTAKLKRAGQYGFCRLKAESKAVKKGELPDYSKCDDQYAEKWAEAESNAGGACPSSGDEASIHSRLANNADAIAASLAGNPVPDPAFPASGQTTCWTTAGAVTSCTGTGQDGELQGGAPLAYTDNGDGTITDLNTGLMWEKIVDDSSLHDKDHTYTFTEAVTVHIAGLNTEMLGGFSDWRVPSVKELQSLLNYEKTGGAVNVALSSGCTFGCGPTTCSCTAAGFYWSSTTSAGLPTYGWGVDFDQGFTSRTGKTNPFYVRGVRGGS